MPLPPQTQQLCAQALEAVRREPQHYLTPATRQAIYNSFGPYQYVKKVCNWLGIITARKVIPIWEQYGKPNNLEDKDYSYDPSEMLAMAEEALAGKIIRTELMNIVSDRFYVGIMGMERSTTWPVYHSMFASYEALTNLLDYWQRDNVEEALIAYAGIDKNEPGFWTHTNILYSNFQGYLQQDEIQSALQWILDYYSSQEHESNYRAFPQLRELGEDTIKQISEFVPFDADLNKALEFWEWWLTEAIPQAWELAQQQNIFPLH